jgi:hypothetical protein
MKLFEACYRPIDNPMHSITVSFKADDESQARFIAYRFMDQMGGGRGLVITECVDNDIMVVS